MALVSVAGTSRLSTSPNSYGRLAASASLLVARCARFVRADRRPAERAEQFLQRLVAEKVGALLGEVELHRARRVALLAAWRLLVGPASPRRAVELEIALVDQALHDPVEQVGQRLAASRRPARRRRSIRRAAA